MFIVYFMEKSFAKCIDFRNKTCLIYYSSIRDQNFPLDNTIHNRIKQRNYLTVGLIQNQHINKFLHVRSILFLQSDYIRSFIIFQIRKRPRESFKVTIFVNCKLLKCFIQCQMSFLSTQQGLTHKSFYIPCF